jgi:GTP-binding protein HflX
LPPNLHEVGAADKALLIVADTRDDRESDANTEELRLLAESAGVVVADEMHVRRQFPDARYFIGSGNADDAFLRIQSAEANVAIVGADLSPSQQRNLEKTTTVRVVDRTQLILDIFAQRARTSEGKLQVELAQLQYLLPRLSGKGIEMSRVGGGSAGGVATRGPGETKLETDRRRVRDRISLLKDELEAVVKHRAIQNKSRKQLHVPGAALVGYTSAGKSTLLNLLASSDVEVHARLFATLDPTTRKVDLEDGTSILLSDTVGFIRNLPHHLIAAFRATLEEVTDADFLIHVVDASHPFVYEQRKAVFEVLRDLGVQDKPVVTVFNKSDRIHDQYELRKLVAETPDSCYMSALTGEGRQYIETLIQKAVSRLMKRVSAVVPYDRGDLVALCYEHGRVISTEYVSEGVRIEADIPPDFAGRFAPFESPREQ